MQPSKNAEQTMPNSDVLYMSFLLDVVIRYDATLLEHGKGIKAAEDEEIRTTGPDAAVPIELR